MLLYGGLRVASGATTPGTLVSFLALAWEAVSGGAWVGAQALTAAEVILRRELRFHGILLNSLPDHDPSDSSVHSNAQWISRFLTGVPLYRTVEQWAESVEG